MNFKNIKYLFFLLMTDFVLSSCSETNEDESKAEYANWQERNEEYFNKLFTAAQSDCKILSWSLQHQTGNSDGNGNVLTPTYKNKDYIVVEKLTNVYDELSGAPQQLTAKDSVMYTDSVKVAYQGRLMPTTEHPQGLMFDGSFEGTSYNFTTALSSKFMAGGLVDGFTTALMSMRLGDHWYVYMPADLAYGSSTSKSGIPAYSSLRFEIVLLGVKTGKGAWRSR
uniref:FKBP-type peptidyl-prolyl cis-trans isomerase n=1 Tax=Segatella hominis TaxID=2518605 RepID=UPI0040266FA4